MERLKDQLNLSECELEPLQTLGFIQSHGCLIAFGHDRRVSYTSANAADFFGVETGRIFNREIGQFCSAANLASLERLLPNLKGGIAERFRWAHQSRDYTAWLHVNGNLFVLELDDCDPREQLSPAAAGLVLDFLKSAPQANSIRGAGSNECGCLCADFGI